MYEGIKSIKKCGIEDSYDLEMYIQHRKEDKNQKATNFIANGIVCKNSGGDARCVTGDSVVVVDGQDTKMETVVKEGDIKTVVAYDFLSKKICESRIKNKYSNGVQKTYRVRLYNGKTICCTANHCFWDGKAWKRLRDLKPGDFIGAFPELTKNCKFCNKPIDSKRVFCSLSCTTKYRNVHNNPMKNKRAVEKMIQSKKGCKVWNKGLTKYDHPAIMEVSKRLFANNPIKNPATLKKAQIGIKKYFANESEQKKRQRIKIQKESWKTNYKAKAAVSKTIKEYYKYNPHPMESEESRKRLGKSLKIFHVNHPEAAKKAAKKAQEFFIEHPEKRTHVLIAGRKSLPQKELFLRLLAMIPEKELDYEHFIRTKRSYRFADIAWIPKKIDFEYDGYKHSIAGNEFRDMELSEAGWKTVRFTHEDFSRGDLEQKLVEVIYNENV